MHRGCGRRLEEIRRHAHRARWHTGCWRCGIVTLTQELVLAGTSAAAVIVALQWRARLARLRATLAPAPRDELCDARSLIETAVGRVHRRARDHQVEIDVDPAIAFSLIADRAALVRVLELLIDHGLERGRPGDSVSITATRANGFASFAIADTAAALSAAKLAHLFERFHPDAPATDELFDCKTVVEAHRGRVGAFANPQGGCTVWFTLPTGPALA